MAHSLFVIALLLLSVAFLFYRYVQVQRPRGHAIDNEPSKTNTQDPYAAIEPLDNFDWKTTSPLQIAPLKPKYHLTMALENITLSDIVAVDKTYAERMQIRRQIMDEHTDATIRCNPVCSEAVIELHKWMFGTYLPQRFPTMYTLSSSSKCDGKSHLYNTVSDESIPLHEPDPMAALKTLGAHVDTDFLLLLPSSTAPDGHPLYHLHAFVCCFPSGFSLRRKLGFSLSAIHGPVPGYKQKLEKSLDRFFAKLAVGKAVRRANWAVTTEPRLFAEGGNHLYAGGRTAEAVGEEVGEMKLDLQAQIDVQKAAVVVEECRLRAERQTLFRLPGSGAVVFAFKTYQYRLADVKSQGDGEALAQAIEGLAVGNVPDMAFYKREVVWGDKVKEYLRS